MIAWQQELKAVRARIEADLESHVDHIGRWVRQPSVSWQGDDLRAMARLAAASFEGAGCTSVEIIEGEVHPAVWGFVDAGAPVSLHVYGMLDTAPADQRRWEHDPWLGELVALDGYERVLVGRGSLAAKGPLVAFLSAIASIRAVTGTLPVNIAILAESEELMGSPSYPRLIEHFVGRLATVDASYCLGPAQSSNRTISIGLGLKSLVQIELLVDASSNAEVPNVPLRSSFAALAANPAARLAHALSHLVDQNSNSTLVPELLSAEGSIVSDETAREIIDELRSAAPLWPWSDLPIEGSPRAALGDPQAEVLFGTTITVSGMSSGFLGPATGTMPLSVPSVASAMIEVRCASTLAPEAVVAAIRLHLDEHGCSDVRIKVWGAHAPHLSDRTHPIVAAVVAGVERDGFRPLVWPLQPGGGAWSVVPNRFGVPCVRGGLPGGGRNGNDEYLVITGDERTAGLVELECAHVDRLFAIATAMV